LTHSGAMLSSVRCVLDWSFDVEVAVGFFVISREQPQTASWCSNVIRELAFVLVLTWLEARVPVEAQAR